MSLGDMMTLLKLRKGEYSVVEEKVAPTAVVVGKKIREVSFPQACTLIAVIRKGELIVPHGDTLLEPVDEVIALVHVSQLSQLAALLGPQVPPPRG
jgi:trk system potassium uptake protein TrkA